MCNANRIPISPTERLAETLSMFKSQWVKQNREDVYLVGHVIQMPLSLLADNIDVAASQGEFAPGRAGRPDLWAMCSLRSGEGNFLSPQRDTVWVV
ncbi:hypothetical protein PR048_032019 [Dryococelus australis]|uniref:Uncharacterized protein n=1 Tax=Dryococelus australis TaxID=614101 RepID=A0ABQ9G6X8_9NEOP|nr:hypothetical protein PR048_032019 [Dryococelus australis]